MHTAVWTGLWSIRLHCPTQSDQRVPGLGAASGIRDGCSTRQALPSRMPWAHTTLHICNSKYWIAGLGGDLYNMSALAQ